MVIALEPTGKAATNAATILASGIISTRQRLDELQGAAYGSHVSALAREQLTTFLIKFARDLEDLLRRVVGRERAVIAQQFRHLATVGRAVDDLEMTRRIAGQRDLII